MFYPGQEAGDALVATLLGERSPAGKLPYTWYSRGFVQTRGVIYDNDLRAGQGITYRYWRGARPLLEFGHGLSCESTLLAPHPARLLLRRRGWLSRLFAADTTFSFSWAAEPPQTVSAAALAAGPLVLRVAVTNTGAVDADAVVLVFVKVAVAASADSVVAQSGCPLKSLLGFDRVHLLGGASTVLEIDAGAREIACVDEAGKIMLHPGTITLEAGDIVSSATATTAVTGTAVQLPE